VDRETRHRDHAAELQRRVDDAPVSRNVVAAKEGIMRKGLLLLWISWIIAASSISPVASADDWVGYYESTFCTRLDEGTGSFHDGSNWYDLTPPTPDEQAWFDGTFDPEQNGIPTRVMFGDYTVRQIGSLCG
jgi:hypothetical protein